MNQKFLKGLLALSLAFAVAACSEKDDFGQSEERAPHTANEVFEEETAPPEEQPAPEMESPWRSVVDEAIYYVYATQLRVRSSDSLADTSNVLGYLNTNDQVRVLGPRQANDMVPIEIVSTRAQIQPAEQYFVSAGYLSEKPQNKRVRSDNRFKYFVVQNIASEKMRVYEKLCDDGSCSHRMIFETSIAVGEQKGSKMTVSGYYHITRWVKFYQDHAAKYPSWYDPALPMPPKPGAGVTAWTKKKLMPNGGNVRGAFGWYAAFPGPNAHAQWTHGTLGWGEDKDKYIKVTRGFWANLFTDPRSSGCTRTDNESIAYLRSLIPVGTPLIKIYAKEAYADPSLSLYSEEKLAWPYILTKNGTRQENGEESDREVVLANGTPKDRWLEEGTYLVDAYPEAREFKSGGGGAAKRGKKANVYGLDDSDMRGVFLVDAGLLVNYENPAKIGRGGYSDRVVPDFMKSQSSDYVLP